MYSYSPTNVSFLSNRNESGGVELGSDLTLVTRGNTGIVATSSVVKQSSSNDELYETVTDLEYGKK